MKSLIKKLNENYKMTCFGLILTYINMFVVITIFGSYQMGVFNSYFGFCAMAFVMESVALYKRRKQAKEDRKKEETANEILQKKEHETQTSEQMEIIS